MEIHREERIRERERERKGLKDRQTRMQTLNKLTSGTRTIFHCLQTIFHPFHTVDLDVITRDIKYVFFFYSIYFFL